MTGFASIAREDECATVTVTIRTLNHRFLDLQLRVPQSLAALEPDIRTLVGKYVARGRVELSIALQLRQVPGVEVEFNDDFGRALETALEQARARGLVSGALTPGDLLRIPQAITIRDRQTRRAACTRGRHVRHALSAAAAGRAQSRSACGDGRVIRSMTGFASIARED